MLTLALAALLASEELSPPPLLPALPEVEQRKPLIPMTHATPAPEAAAESTVRPEVETGFSGSRVAITASVAGATGALLVGGSLWFALTQRNNSMGIALLILSLPASLFIGRGLAFAAHRAMGGQGGWGAHLGGGAIGGGIALLATYAILSASHQADPGLAQEVGLIIGSAVVFGLGTALLGELSHCRSVSESGAMVSLVPTRGGALASLSFGF